MDSSNRRPCYVEDDNGLASIAGCNNINNTNNLCYNNNTNKMYNQNDNGVGPILMMRRRNSLKNMSCISSPPLSSLRSGAVARGFDPRFEDHSPHFLEACFLCRKPLGDNRDIFMYRGDTPFCSEECRQEQIEKDEAKEKNINFKAMRSKKDSSTSSKSTSPSSSPQRQNYPFRTGTVAAA